MINFLFQTDDETTRLFKIVVWCLQKYFEHTQESAIEAINAYYTKNINRIDDDFYHHEMPFRVALRIQYSEVWKKGSDRSNEFYDWMRKSGYHNTPYEVLDYFRKNYFIDSSS
jgi:hypothetical protein